MIKNILCIDNNKVFVKSLSRILLKHDMYVSPAYTLSEADDVFKSVGPHLDLIMLGNVFPDGKTGFEIAELFRKKWHFKKTIMMLTAQLDEETLTNAKNSEINILLPKKIKESELLAHIKILETLDSFKHAVKVLIIDDSAFIRKRMSFELSNNHFTVLEAENGMKGQIIAREKKPDIIILDIDMPGQDGYETCRALKRNHETVDIPVVFFSATQDPEARNKANEVGGVEFFPKDASSGELLRFLTALIEKLHAQKIKKGLLIEDSDLHRHVVEYYCSKEEYEITSVDCLKKARESLIKNQYDFILCDLYLSDPFEEVLAFIKDVTGNEQSRFTPLIVISSSDKTSDLVHSLENGAHDFLKKPFSPEELIVRINNQIKVKDMMEYIMSQNAHLRTLSITDYLTDTFNRNHLDTMIDTAINRFHRKQIPFGALMIDINDFKYINDTFGHVSGDEALKSVARTLSKSVRPTDMVFRFGGDEFMIILEGAEEKDLDIVISRINSNLGTCILSNEEGKFHKLSISIGGLCYSGGLDKKDFIDNADKKMFEMKKIRQPVK